MDVDLTSLPTFEFSISIDGSCSNCIISMIKIVTAACICSLMILTRLFTFTLYIIKFGPLWIALALIYVAVAFCAQT